MPSVAPLYLQLLLYQPHWKILLGWHCYVKEHELRQVTVIRCCSLLFADESEVNPTMCMTTFGAVVKMTQGVCRGQIAVMKAHTSRIFQLRTMPNDTAKGNTLLPPKPHSEAPNWIQTVCDTCLQSITRIPLQVQVNNPQPRGNMFAIQQKNTTSGPRAPPPRILSRRATQGATLLFLLLLLVQC